MRLDHVAIWSEDIDLLRDFYVRFFGGQSNEKYINVKNGFQSYFITFKTGARLELMSMPGIAQNRNEPISKQHMGIIHIAFGVETMAEVDKNAEQLEAEGYSILTKPRKTGDGYYEFEALDPDCNRIEVTTKFEDHI